MARLSVLTPGAPGGGSGGGGGANGPPNVFGLASRAPDEGLHAVSSPTRFSDAGGRATATSLANGNAAGTGASGGGGVAGDEAVAGGAVSFGCAPAPRIEWTPAVLERCALVQMLVQLAVASPPLADELYLQLIKLTTDSPGVLRLLYPSSYILDIPRGLTFALILYRILVQVQSRSHVLLHSPLSTVDALLSLLRISSEFPSKVTLDIYSTVMHSSIP